MLNRFPPKEGRWIVSESLEDKIRAINDRIMQRDCTEAEAEALHAQAQALIDAEFSEEEAPKPMSTVAAFGNTLKVGIVVLIFVVLAIRIFMIGPTAFWYTLRHNMILATVVTEPRPTDCDFWHAPVGLKDCHYERAAWPMKAQSPYVLLITWVKKAD
jgi:hypothetical protein